MAIGGSGATLGLAFLALTSKSKQLKTKNQTVTLNFEKGKMTYYFHGNDLMFSYGKIKRDVI